MKPFFDVHVTGCDCSWCGKPGFYGAIGKPMRYGLNIPPGWREKYSWFVIKFWPHRYIRWCRG